MKNNFFDTQVLCVQYLLSVLLLCRKKTWKLFFDLFCKTGSQLEVSWNTVGYWLWKIQQISALLDCCELWCWFGCTGFVAVFNPRLLIISLTVLVLYGFVAIPDLRLLIINLIAFNGVLLYDGAMRRFCWWSMTVKRMKILRRGVRRAYYGSFNVHGCSHVESVGCCRESWHTVGKPNTFAIPVFNLINEGS